MNAVTLVEPSLTLVRYEAMCRSVAECHRVDEAKDIRDKAEALRAYAKQANNLELEVQFAEVKVRAEIKCGELLGDMAVHRQRNTGGKPGHDVRVTLAEVGLSEKQSTRFQQAAKATSEEVEKAFSIARETLVPVTSVQIRGLVKLRNFTPHETAASGDATATKECSPTVEHDDGKPLHCSFCAKTQFEILKLIAGPGCFICNECVELCNENIREEMEKVPRSVSMALRLREFNEIVRIQSAERLAAELSGSDALICYQTVQSIAASIERLLQALAREFACGTIDISRSEESRCALPEQARRP